MTGADQDHTSATVATAGDHRSRAGRYSADIDPIGATLRTLQLDDRDLVVSYPAGTVRPLYRGAAVAPWPNRIENGRYSFGGKDFQLAVNEVERGHALHGPVQWIRYTVVDSAEDRITLRHDLVPQDGYPFPLRLTVTFALADDGLTTTLTAVNTGDTPGSVDDWTLRMAADQRLEVDDLLIPTTTADVARRQRFPCGWTHRRQRNRPRFHRSRPGRARTGGHRGNRPGRRRGANVVRTVGPVGADPHRGPARARMEPQRPRGRADVLSAERVQLRHRCSGALARRAT